MKTIAMRDIIARYNPGEGRHFFDKGSMRFFDSKLHGPGYEAADGSIYFVTSEQFHGSGGYSAPRKYSVRVLKDQRIDKAGEFQKFDSESVARAFAKDLAS